MFVLTFTLNQECFQLSWSRPAKISHSEDELYTSTFTHSFQPSLAIGWCLVDLRNGSKLNVLTLFYFIINSFITIYFYVSSFINGSKSIIINLKHVLFNTSVVTLSESQTRDFWFASLYDRYLIWNHNTVDPSYLRDLSE